MGFFVSKFKWIMLVAGLMTATMFQGLILPQSTFQSDFGEPLQGQANELIFRSWSALIGVLGLMLIYGAFVEPVRRFALLVSGATKLSFVVIGVIYGTQYFSARLGIAVLADVIFIIIFAAYLVLSRRPVAD